MRETVPEWCQKLQTKTDCREAQHDAMGWFLTLAQIENYL